MMDQVELLEQHVETLLTLLESAKAKIGELVHENGGLKRQVNQLTVDLKEHVDQVLEVSTQNEQLQAQVHELEEDVEGMTSKETQIRDRLRLILGKIDSIETELTSAGGAE